MQRSARFLEIAGDCPPAQLIRRNQDLLEAGLLEDYIASANVDSDQRNLVADVIKQDTFEGFLVWLHEALEMLDLAERYSIEQVKDGTAHSRGYNESHLAAIRGENEILRRIAMHLGFKGFPVELVGAIFHPLIERLGRFDVRAYPEARLEMLARLGAFFGDVVAQQKVKQGDLDEGLEFLTHPVIGHRFQRVGFLRASAHEMFHYGSLKPQIVKIVNQRIPSGGKT